jgi:hypothetical protein
MAWVLERLGVSDELRGAGARPEEIVRGSASVVARLDRHDPTSVEATPSTIPIEAPSAETQLALFDGVGEALPPVAPRLRELPTVPDPPPYRVSRLSYSAIALFERCSYRYWVERVAGMRPAPWAPREEGGGGLHATEIGDAVHRLLEDVDLAFPAVPADLVARVRSWYPGVTDDEIDVVRGYVHTYVHSELARRIAALPGARPERPFAFEHDGVVVNGRLDVLWRGDGDALVLDYKTNVLDGRDPTEVVEAEYRVQRLVYALACLRAGVSRVEVVYHFLEDAGAVVSSSFTTDDAPALESELSAMIARIRGGDVAPTPSVFACSGCPALDRVCAGPRLGGGAWPAEPMPELTAAG